MIFILGGSDQGKTDFALERFGRTASDVFVCDEETREIDFSKRIVAHIERFALGCVRRGEEPIEYWLAHMDEMRASILISDDVSCGIVPIDTTLRAWREANGRANNRLAREAGEVWRVFCGLGQRLK